MIDRPMPLDDGIRFFDLTRRAQQIAMALSILGCCADNRVAARIDRAATLQDITPGEAIRQHHPNLRPGFKTDPATRTLMRSPADVADYVDRYLARVAS